MAIPDQGMDLAGKQVDAGQQNDGSFAAHALFQVRQSTPRSDRCAYDF
jgi:hypothetical protein